MATNRDFIVKNGLSVGGDIAVTGNVTSDLHLNDNAKIKIGSASNGDLQIYHTTSGSDANNSFIEDIGTGSLYLRADTSVRIQSYGDNNDMIRADKAGAVTLYHNNGARLATTASGISVPGTASIGEVSVQSELFLGSSSNGKLTQSGSSWLFHTYASGAFGERFRILDTGANVTGNLDTTTLSSGNITTTGYLRGPSTFTIDPATHADNTGTVVIAGNLTVDGTQTTINSTTLTVDDKNIVLASGAADSAAANGAGITVDGASATLLYASSGDKFAFNKSLDITGNATVSGEVRTTNVNTASSTGVLALYGGATNPGGKIVLSGGNNTGATGSGIAFHAGASTANPAERMRILSGGNVGIGTDAPGTKLHVSAGSTNANTIVRLQQGTTAGNYSGIELGRTDGSGNVQTTPAIFGGVPISGIAGVVMGSTNTAIPAVAIQSANSSNGHIVFNPKGQEKVRISADGKVGIGNNDPQGRLHLNDSGTAIPTSGYGTGLMVSRTDGLMGTMFGFLNSPQSGYLQGANFTNTDTKPFLINPRGGNVGIGTTNPSTLLTVSETASDHTSAAISIENTQNGGYGGILNFVSTRAGTQVTAATIGTDGMENWSDVASTSSNLKFSTVNDGTLAERMRIHSSGKVGIGTGTSIPSSLLELRKTTAGLITGGSGNTGPVLTLHHEAQWENGYSGGDWLGAIDFSTGDASVGEGVRASIRTTVNNYYNTHALAFYTANQGDTTLDERMRIKENGLVGIGTQSPLAKLHVRGDSTDTRLLLEMDGDDVGGEAKLQFKVDSQDADTRIKAAIIFQREDPGTRGTGNLHFAVEGSNNDTNATTAHSRIMIQSDGNVGIGNTNPKRPLQIGETGSFPISFNGNYPDSHMNTYYESGWRIHTAGFGAKTTFNGATGAFGFSNVASSQSAGANFTPEERLTILANGNVGIGNTNPSDRLVVQKDSANIEPILVIKNDNTTDDNGTSIDFSGKDTGGNNITYGRIAAMYSNHATEKSHMIFSHRNNTGNFAQWMRVTHDGRVAIGAHSPSAPLHIQTADGTTNSAVNSLTITNLSSGTTTTGFGGEIRFQAQRNNGVNQNTGGIRSIAEVNSGTNISSGLAFDTGTAGVTSEKMRITNTGIVDIGKAAFSNAPTGSKFNVYGDGEVFRLDGTGGTSRTFRFRNVSTGNPGIITADGSLEIGTEDANTSIGLLSMRDITYKTTKTNSTAGHHKFYSHNTEIVRIDGQHNRVGIMQSNPTIPLDIEPDSSKRIFGSQQNNTQHGFCEYLISGTIGAGAVTITMQCSSYWQAEVTATFQQSNGGSDNNVYFNGIWSNNHTTHLFKNKTNGGTVPQIGSMGVTPTYSVGVGDAASNSGKLVFTKPALANSSGTYTVRVVAYGYGSKDMTYVVS